MNSLKRPFDNATGKLGKFYGTQEKLDESWNGFFVFPPTVGAGFVFSREDKEFKKGIWSSTILNILPLKNGNVILIKTLYSVYWFEPSNPALFEFNIEKKEDHKLRLEVELVKTERCPLVKIDMINSFTGETSEFCAIGGQFCSGDLKQRPESCPLKERIN